MYSAWTYDDHYSSTHWLATSKKDVLSDIQENEL